MMKYSINQYVIGKMKISQIHLILSTLVKQVLVVTPYISIASSKYLIFNDRIMYIRICIKKQSVFLTGDVLSLDGIF
jgi:hypothetical protein